MIDGAIIVTNWKLLILAITHGLLSFIVMTLGAAGPRAVLLLPRRFIANISMRILIALCFVMGTGLVTSAGYDYFGLTTMFFITAGFLTIWYLELAIILANGFFKRLFDEDMPFEITLFISFVVMVNAGYFTLMFLVSVIRSPQFFS